MHNLYKFIILIALYAYIGIANSASCFPPGYEPVSEIQATEPRIALLVGNANYKGLPTTPNAANDARDLATELTKLGFDVICGVDLTRKEFKTRLKQFRKRIDRMDDNAVSLFFYAGHGVQINSKNYMIPLSAMLDDPDYFEDEAISLEYVMRTMIDANNKQGSKFVILDACRDNPLGNGWGQARASFSTRGMSLSFGAGYGQLASDGSDRNGLFTKHILKNIHTPGATFDQVMKMVTHDVSEESDGKQVPELSSSSVREFMFVPGERLVINLQKTPLWQKSIYWGGLVLLVILAIVFYNYQKKTAWTKGIDLKSELKIDPKVADEVRRKSRLASDEIRGYVKDVKQKKLLGLITAKHNLVLGHNNNANIVLPSDTVSGEHAQIGWDEAQSSFWLEDLQSTNGTWWGRGQRVEPGQRHLLKSGQLFYLADEQTPMVIIAHEDGA